jgi:hypothetical protein
MARVGSHRGSPDRMGERTNGILGKWHKLGEVTALGGERVEVPFPAWEFGEGTSGQPVHEASETPGCEERKCMSIGPGVEV